MINHLIRRNLPNRAEYGSGLSNHLPMALIALQELGASEEELRNFHDIYVGRIKPRPMDTYHLDRPIDFAHDLGKRHRELAWRNHYAKLAETRSVDDLLNQEIPKLAAGVSASAFHALIRLSYALEAQNKDETVASLAYWAATYQPLSCQGMPSKADDAERGLEKLRRAMTGKAKPLRGPNITIKIKKAAQLKDFTPPALTMHPRDYINNGADVCARLFGRKLEFTTLHMMTSFTALREVCDHLAPQTQQLLCQAHWLGICAAYRALGCPNIPSEQEANDWQSPDNWDDINKLVRSSMDEHIFKAAYTCRKEEHYCGRSYYKGLAWRHAQHQMKHMPMPGAKKQPMPRP